MPQKGQPVVAGNIDLRRPEVDNPTGGKSTVYSMSFLDEDPQSLFKGLEVLVPLADEGRILSEQEAMAKYYGTPPLQRQHLGVFMTPEDADTAAERLHNEYAAGKYKPTLQSELLRRALQR